MNDDWDDRAARQERRVANVKWILKVVYGIEEPDERQA